MQRLFNGLSADRRLILKIAMHMIFYKRILVMFIIKERNLLFYIEELSITDGKRVTVTDQPNLYFNTLHIAGDTAYIHNKLAMRHREPFQRCNNEF